MLKSIFVSAYMMAAMIITVFAVRKLWISGDVITWGGVILTTAPFLVVLGWLMVLRNTARTSARFPSLIVLGIAGVTAATWGYTQGGSKLALELALAGLVAYLVYAYWYSSFRHRHSRQIEVGRFLPEFELKDISGYPVSSASLTQRPTIWIFYRGNWCPFCTAQIEELAAAYQQLNEAGINVVLISPQSIKKNQALADRFDVPMTFLRDRNNTTAKLLGIVHRWGTPMGLQLLGYESDTVLPTIILTDSHGRIVFSDQTDNYRVRPKPAAFEALLKAKQADS